ncbi:hypothetical protein N431DRAFT_452804 [Stipitochalara longipes BDJ]|nr:hypothetical protein N431DRAFT_452804 [Stipitochalara longipes BDJ]
MGCYPSLLRWRLRSPFTITDGEQPPISKSFDSDSQSCKSPYSLGASIELKSPIISTDSLSPLALPSNQKPKSESIKISTEPLDLPINEINHKIASLTSAIQDYESSTGEAKDKTIVNLNAILDIISENSLVHTKLEILRSHISNLYFTRDEISLHYFSPAIESFPVLWKEFVDLDENSRREQARKQSSSMAIMRMVTILANLRSACNIQRDLYVTIEKKMGSQFEDILGGLKDIGAQDAAMKWRVLGMVTGKRGEEEEHKLEDILKVRMRVSGLLIEVVEALRENDE